MMITIEEALEIVSRQEVNPPVIRVPLDASLGFYLAEQLYAPFDVPAFDNSSVDGYALCGNTESFTVVGEIPAGEPGTHVLEPGQAMRIFTGARVPTNTSSIIMQENTRVSGNLLELTHSTSPGQFIRQQGGELTRGTEAFSPGHKITAATLGFMGSLGFTSISVYGKPKVGAIATGNELIGPGEDWTEGKIYESSRLAISGAMLEHDLVLQEALQVSDDLSLITRAVSRFLDWADLLILTGGISVGDYDFVKKALTEAGVEQLFYRVSQKPGKPLYFGRKGSQFVFGLPGNPASALTCFYIYVLPLLQRMSGARETGLLRIRLPLEHPFEFKTDRPSFLKARIRDGQVILLDGQQSSMIHSFSHSNALVYLKSSRQLNKGDHVECILL